MFLEILSLIAVGALWGGTNPLIKRGTRKITEIRAESRIVQFFSELKYLFSNLNYIIPMGLNQAGSILYFFTLQNVDISLAVPVANSLTFVFTAVSAWILGEDIPTKKTCFGISLILAGTTLLCYDKYLQNFIT